MSILYLSLQQSGSSTAKPLFSIPNRVHVMCLLETPSWKIACFRRADVRLTALSQEKITKDTSTKDLKIESEKSRRNKLSNPPGKKGNVSEASKKESPHLAIPNKYRVEIQTDSQTVKTLSHLCNTIQQIITQKMCCINQQFPILPSVMSV